MARHDRPAWLVVLDDLQTPADLTAMWPPPTPTGTVLVTTRRRDAALAGSGRRMLHIGVFTPEEAAGYLRRKLPREPVDQLHLLAADLGYLPLALAQAAAYLTDRGLDCTRCRARLADRRNSLAQLLPEPEALPDEYRATVAATWSMSVAAADRLHPHGLAKPLLQLAALLDPNGIPIDVFTTSAVTDHLRRGDDGGDSIGPESVADALHNLRRLSLVTHSADQLQVHALVQRVARENLTANQLDTIARVVADALLQRWPAPERDNLVTSQVLRANTMRLYDRACHALLHPGCHAVLFRAGKAWATPGNLPQP